MSVLALIIFIIFVALLGVAGYFVYKYYFSSTPPASPPTPSSPPSSFSSMLTATSEKWVLSWSNPTQGTPPLTFYYYLIDIQTNSQVYTSPGITGTSTDLNLDSLTLGDHYDIYVYAQNAAGKGPTNKISNWVFQIPPAVTFVTGFNSPSIFVPSGSGYGVNIVITASDNLGSVKATLTYKGTNYVQFDDDPSGNQSNISWCAAPSGCSPIIAPNDTITLTIETTNGAGTSTFTNNYTAPAPIAVSPSGVNNLQIKYA